MRVIAATFSDRKSAERALEQLRERYELRSSDAEVAPFGALERDLPHTAVLAGRFYDERDSEVRDLIEQYEGAVAVDVDESQTRRVPREREGTESGDPHRARSREPYRPGLGLQPRQQSRAYL